MTALLFTILKEKGAMLISGFNTMSKEERKLYDKAKMSKDQRNACIIWTCELFANEKLQKWKQVSRVRK
jgi:hypothetical protein